jgi:thiol-disulfide isomerase/thioredoxin
MKWIRLSAALLLLVAAVGALWQFVRHKRQETELLPPSTPYTAKDYIRERTPQAGQAARNYTLPTLGGKLDRLFEQGKPAVLNFWATWCDSCQEEMNAFQKAYTQYGDRVRIRMVNATFMENEKVVPAFVSKHGWTFPVLLDRKGDTTMNYTGVGAYPQTYFIDNKGRIVYHQIGFLSERDLMRRIQSLLEKEGARP